MITASEVYGYILKANPSGRYPAGIDEKSKKLLEEVFFGAAWIRSSGTDEYVKEFWVSAPSGTYAEFREVFAAPHLSEENLIDAYRSFAPYDKRWFLIRLVQRAWDVFAIFIDNWLLYGEGFGDIQMDSKKVVSIAPLLRCLLKETLKVYHMVEREEYMAYLEQNLPFENRIGTIDLREFRRIYPGDFEKLVGSLSPETKQEFVEWVVGNVGKEGVKGMTTSVYLEACSLIYKIMAEHADEWEVDDLFREGYAECQKMPIRAQYIRLSEMGACAFTDVDESSISKFKRYEKEHACASNDEEDVLDPDVAMIVKDHALLYIKKADGWYYLVPKIIADYAATIEVAMALVKHGFPVWADYFVDLMNLVTGVMDVKIEPYGINSLEQLDLWEKYFPLPLCSRLVKPPYPRVLIEKAKWEIYPYVDFDDSPPEEPNE